MSEAVYVVQQRREGGKDVPGVQADYVWEDIATVTVPARTHRKTVIEKALDQAFAPTAPGTSVLRVLDEGSARETKVEMEQPPPRLKIG
jgi:hypothetical protein